MRDCGEMGREGRKREGRDGERGREGRERGGVREKGERGVRVRDIIKPRDIHHRFCSFLTLHSKE